MTRRLFRSGQIPLWSVVASFVALVIAVCVWTYYSTRPEAADGRITIVFWNAAEFGTDIYAAIRQFEHENPRYKVIASSSASRSLTSDAQRLLCAVAGEVPPDLVLFDRFAIGEWAGRGALEPLDKYLDSQDRDDKYYIDRTTYYDWAIQEATYGPPGTVGLSKLYGMPAGIDIRLLYTNTNQLRQAEIGHPPTTWNELQADARKLTIRNPDGTLKRVGFAPNYGDSWLYLYAFQAGGRLLNESSRVVDGKTYPPRTLVTFADPEIVRALRFMADIYDEAGGVGEVDKLKSGFIQGDAHDPFLVGQVAMKIDGDWALPTIAQYGRDMEFGLTPAPMPDDLVARGVKPVTWSGGSSLVVPSTAKDKDGAFKLMQFLLSRQTYRFLHEGGRQAMESQGQLFLPRPVANRAVLKDIRDQYIDHNTKIPESFKRAYATIDQMLENTLIRPPSPVGQLLWDYHIIAMDDALALPNWSKLTDRQKDDQIRGVLRNEAVPVQRRLDEIVDPLPPQQVRWSPYFVGYAALVAVPFIALIAAVRRNRKIYRAKETAAAMMFLSPWLVGITCLTLGPILFSVVLSFTRYDVLSPARYTGLQNYRNLFSDQLFYKSLGNTGYMLLRIPLGMALSLAIAILLNQKVRGVGLFRTAFYMPTIVPLVAMALLWLGLLNDSYGIVNVVLRWLFATAPAHWVETLVNQFHPYADGPFHFRTPGWLTAAPWCKPSMILMGLWTAGGGMIIWLAGLQSIPAQLYEAATVDGAGPWKQFLNVTLPMLSPYILFNAIIGVIGTMQMFNEAYIMFPDGGANNAGLFYAFHLFRESFQFFNMGYSSAMAWILFLIVLALTGVQVYFSKKWVHYDRT